MFYERVNVTVSRGDLVGTLRDAIKRWTAFIGQTVQPPIFELHVFLVRTGQYVPSEDAVATWPLAPDGEEDARWAAKLIRHKLRGAKATVILDAATPISYQQTAQIIATELGATVVYDRFAHPPHTADLPRLEEFGGPVVVMVNGSHLAAELRALPGPLVSLGLLGPPFGSVHHLVIKYRHHGATLFYQEVSREFV